MRDDAVGGPDLPGEEVVMTSRGVGPAGHAARASRPELDRARREKRKVGEEDVDMRDTTREKRARQTTIEEMYDKEKLAEFSDAWLQWIYANGLPFNAFRGPEFQRVRRAAERVPRTVRFQFPSYRVTTGAGIHLQRMKVALMSCTRAHDKQVLNGAESKRQVRCGGESLELGNPVLTEQRVLMELVELVHRLQVGRLHLESLVPGASQLLPSELGVQFRHCYAVAGQDVVQPCSTRTTRSVVQARMSIVVRDMVHVEPESKLAPPRDRFRLGLFAEDGNVIQLGWAPGGCGGGRHSGISLDLRLQLQVRCLLRRPEVLMHTLDVADVILQNLHTGGKGGRPCGCYSSWLFLQRLQPCEHLVHCLLQVKDFLLLQSAGGHEVRDALESMLHGDAWARMSWDRRLIAQAQWVQQQIRDEELWRCVDYSIRVMAPVHQLLRRMDRGGMMMSIVYEWSQHLLELMRRVDVPADMVEPCVREVAICNLHMLEPAHAAAHLLNPRQRSLRYYESLQPTSDNDRVVEECDRFLLTQTGDDPVGRLYRTMRDQMRHFHLRRGDWGDRQLSDAEADDCRGDRETERCATWWFAHGRFHPELRTIAIRVMHLWTFASPAERNWAQHERINTARHNKLGFANRAQLVEIATNLKLAACTQQGGGYVLSWVMGTGREGTAGGEEDDEGDVKPEVWGARPADSVSEQDIKRQVIAFHACRLSRSDPVEDVFGKRATELRPWTEYTVGADDTPDADADDDTSDDQWTDDDDAAIRGDAMAERVYFTYGGGPDGMAPHTSVITDDVPSGGQASGTGRGRGRRR
ncbi:hypothetical protein CBR_g37401 [Chara braunii]|uniref:Uncharacterized protein n=1 Tax=Chara braunii TaxID=69332 RepID=A0A388LMN1_CHABU|nr:hypothetical protein CBR_g37401 [Chara braunii]|eukprot:GBG83596.1 hypothetical protein CBR_g37401 [Chara braunii]